MDAVKYARHYAGYVILHQAFARRADRLVIEVAETLMLEPDGSTRIEMETRVVGAQMVGCRVMDWANIPVKLREGRTPDDRPAPAGTLLPTELRWPHHWCTTPVYEPMDDAALRALQEQERPYLGVISQWPSEVTSGRVSLAGSQDRWVIALGQGSHLENLPGTYVTAEAAGAALTNLIKDNQAVIARELALRCEDPIRCEFPPVHIEVTGDASVKATTLENREARRAAAQALRGIPSQKRATASRANGRKGGRPRKQP